jgi:hypothetical protein
VDIVSDELREIDAAAIEELSRIKDEQQVLEQRLARMEEEKANVSELVYERVRRDYVRRSADLEERARPLKEEARAQYRKLRSVGRQAEQDADQARLDKEEVELRHRLGEIDDETFKERLGACEEELGERQARLRDVEELRERFLAAFRSPEELEAPAHDEPPEDEAPPDLLPDAEPEEFLDTDATTLKVEEETVLRGDTAPVEAAPVEAAPVDTVRAAAPPPADSEATMLLKGPRLVIHRGDSLEELRLGPEPITVGRAVKNAVRFLSTSVSRHHARIIVGDSGYMVRDLGSGNGTLVNSEPVTGDRQLRDGDVIQVGSEVLVYRDR